MNVQKMKGHPDPDKMMQLDMLCRTIADIYLAKIVLDVALKEKHGDIAQFVDKIKQSNEYSNIQNKVVQYDDTAPSTKRGGKGKNIKKNKRRRTAQQMKQKPGQKDSVAACGLPHVTRDFMIQKYGLMPLAMKNFRNFYTRCC